MEWKRAKNIILCMLLFANLFLAVNLGTLISSRLTEQKDKTALAIENLLTRGHSVASNAEKNLSYELYTYNVKRD
ncbi:MAG: hypothetical protein IKU13_04685, partial [Clostridia bacterium]|nr:hypothetical protein [Clostridia bacterium]